MLRYIKTIKSRKRLMSAKWYYTEDIQRNKINLIKSTQIPFVLDRFCLEDNLMRSLEMTLINQTFLSRTHE